jgi:hypothetical protein
VRGQVVVGARHQCHRAERGQDFSIQINTLRPTREK